MRWVRVAQVNLHMQSGMMVLYTVNAPASSNSNAAPAIAAASGGVVRTYYIAAENVTW